jgi:16S rRNA G966 N2-methylase RsmD
MEWKNEGKIGVLTSGKLERSLYLSVNKALEAMGGEWKTKQKGFVFTEDPRPLVEGLLQSGKIQVARDGFFETPPSIIARMFQLAPLPLISDLNRRVLEPSAGRGRIASELSRCMKECYMTLIENNHERATFLQETFRNANIHEMDFLEYGNDFPAEREGFARVYANPPIEWDQDILHVMHAYDLLAPGGILVSVMSEGPFFKKTKKAKEFQEWFQAVDGTSEKNPDGAFSESGTNVATRLVIIRA